MVNYMAKRTFGAFLFFSLFILISINGQSLVPSGSDDWLQVTSSTNQGGRDSIQTVFFQVPDSYTSPIYFGICDPETNGVAPDQNTGTTYYYLLGGDGCYTNSNSREEFYSTPADSIAAGTGDILYTYEYNNTFTEQSVITPVGGSPDVSDDEEWAYFPPVYPSQGEHVGDYYYFRMVVNASSSYKNAYKLVASSSLMNPATPVEITSIRAFAYSWCFDNRKNLSTWSFYPFVPDSVNTSGGLDIHTNDADSESYDLYDIFGNSRATDIPSSGTNWSSVTQGYNYLFSDSNTGDPQINGTWQIDFYNNEAGAPNENTIEIWSYETGSGICLPIYTASYTPPLPYRVTASVTDDPSLTGSDSTVHLQIVDSSGSSVPYSRNIYVSDPSGNLAFYEEDGTTSIIGNLITTNTDGFYAFNCRNSNAESVEISFVTDGTLGSDALAGTNAENDKATVTHYTGAFPTLVSTGVSSVSGSSVSGIDFNITDDDGAYITASDNIYLRIPDSIDAQWNQTLSGSFSGSAFDAGLVGTNPIVHYEDSRTIRIDVNSDFTSDNDTLVISGLGFTSSNSASSGDFEMAYDGLSGLWNVVDSLTAGNDIIINPATYFIWNGSAGDGNFDNGSNWQYGAAPGHRDGANIVLTGSGTDAVLSYDALGYIFGEVTITSGAKPEIAGGSSLQVNTSYENNGTLVFSDTVNIETAAGVFNSSSSLGNVELDGSLGDGTGNVNYGYYNDLTSTAGNWTFTASVWEVVINGDASLTTGSWTMTGGPVIYLSGSWANDGITINNSYELRLYGSDPCNITGTGAFSTFYSLICEEPGKVISFETGAINHTVSFGNLRMAGSASSPIILKGIINADWFLNVTSASTVDISYVDVQYSTADISISADFSIDSGNNSNWDFGTGKTTTWDGSNSESVTTVPNWDNGAPDDSGTGVDSVIIPDVSLLNFAPVLTGGWDLGSGSLTIGDGGTLDIDAYNVNVAVLNNEGTIYAHFGSSLTGVSLDTDSGVVSYSGVGGTGLPLGNNYHDLVIDAGNWTLNNNLVVNGDLVINGGTLDAGIYNITVSGDFSHIGGTVTGTTGSITVSGDSALNSSISYSDAAVFQFNGGLSSSTGSVSSIIGSISVTANNNLLLTGVLDAGNGGSINLTANGSITQTGGSIDTGTSGSISAVTYDDDGGDIILDQGNTALSLTLQSLNNAGDTIVSGDIIYVDDDGFTMALIETNGFVDLTCTSATINDAVSDINQSGDITARDGLVLRGAADISIDGVTYTNSIGPLAVDTTGWLSFADDEDISLGTVNSLSGLSAENIQFDLTGASDYSVSITQRAAAPILCTGLILEGNYGNFQLDTAAAGNLVGTVALYGDTNPVRVVYSQTSVGDVTLGEVYLDLGAAAVRTGATNVENLTLTLDTTSDFTVDNATVASWEVTGDLALTADQYLDNGIDLTSGGNVTLTLTTATSLSNIWTFNGTTSYDDVNSLTYLNDVTITGTLTAANTIYVAGGWTNSGTFNHGNQTVEFVTATESVISGVTTFYNFICQEPGKTLTFVDTETHVITNNLTIQGDNSSLPASVVTLSSLGTWGFDWLNGGTANIDYAVIGNGNLDSNDITADNSINLDSSCNLGGGYSNSWIFSAKDVTWEGNTDTLWSTDSNWDWRFVPNPTDNVIIPDADTTTNDPVLDGDITVNSLTLETNGDLVASTYDIIVTGALSMSNDGTDYATLTGDGGDDGLMDLTIGGEATLNGTISYSNGADLVFTGGISAGQMTGSITITDNVTTGSIDISGGAGNDLQFNGGFLDAGTGSISLDTNGGDLNDDAADSVVNLTADTITLANIGFVIGQSASEPLETASSGNCVMTLPGGNVAIYIAHTGSISPGFGGDRIPPLADYGLSITATGNLTLPANTIESGDMPQTFQAGGTLTIPAACSLSTVGDGGVTGTGDITLSGTSLAIAAGAGIIASTGTGDISLTQSAGALTLDRALSVNSGDITLDGENEAVTISQALTSVSGNINLLANSSNTADPANLIIGGILSAGGNISLTSYNGTISQSAAISGVTLNAVTYDDNGSDIILPNGGNDFTSINIRSRDNGDANNDTGNITYVDADDFDIVQLGTAGFADLTCTSGTLSDGIADISQSGPINVGSLAVRGTGDIGLDDDVNNSIPALAVDTTGWLVFSENEDVEIGSVNGLSGLTATEYITLIHNNADSSYTYSITQTQPVSSTRLILEGSYGNFVLNGAGNLITWMALNGTAAGTPLRAQYTQDGNITFANITRWETDSSTISRAGMDNLENVVLSATSGDLTIDGPDAGNDVPSWQVGGNFTLICDQLFNNGATINSRGNVTLTLGTASTLANTWIFDGTTDFLIAGSPITLNDIQVGNGSGGTLSFNDASLTDIDINGDITASNGTLLDFTNDTVTTAGNVNFTGLTGFTSTNSNISFDDGILPVQTVISAGQSFNNISVTGVGISAADDFDANGTAVFSAGTSSAAGAFTADGLITLDTGTPVLTTTGTLTANAGITVNTGGLTADGDTLITGDLIVSGSGSMGGTGNIDVNGTGNVSLSGTGTFTCNTRTIILTGNWTENIGTFDVSGGSSLIRFDGGGASTINGVNSIDNLTIDNGTTLDISTNPLTCNNDVIVNGVMDSNGQNLTILGTVSDGGTLTDARTLQTTGGETLDIEGDISVATFTVNTGTSPVIQAASGFTPGTFTCESSSIVLDGGNSGDLGGYTFYDLTFAKDADTDVITSTDDLTVTNSLIMTTGGWDAGEFTHTISGGWNSTSPTFLFTAGSTTSTVLLTNGSVSHQAGEGFYNFTADGTITASSNFEAGNVLSIPDSRSFSSVDNDIDVTGNLNLYNSSSLSITGTGSLSIGGTTAIGAGSTLSLGNGLVALGNDTTDTIINLGSVTSVSTGAGNVTFAGDYIGTGTGALTGSTAGNPQWTFEQNASFGSVTMNGDPVWFDSDVITHTLSIDGASSFDTLVVSTDDTVTLAGAGSFTAAVLQTGDTAADGDSAVFDAVSMEFTITTLNNGGYFYLVGDQVASSVTNYDIDSGETYFYGTGDSLSGLTTFYDLTLAGTGSRTFPAAVNVYHNLDASVDSGVHDLNTNTTVLTFRDETGAFNTGVGTYTPPGPPGTAANLTFYALVIEGGNTLTAAGDIVLEQNWTNSGTFAPGIYDISFTNGTIGSTLVGNTTFNDFTCTALGKTLTFTDGTTQAINGDLTLTGASGVGNMINLTGTSNTGWTLDNVNDTPTDLETVDYVTVAYGQVNSNSITATHSVNMNDSSEVGTATCWDFSPKDVTWSGSLGNDDWDTGSNWNFGYAPNDNDNVIIPDVTGSSFLQPVITSTNITVADLEISASATLEVGDGSTLDIDGDYDNLGNLLRAGTTTVNYNGTIVGDLVDNTGLTTYTGTGGTIQVYTGNEIYYDLSVDGVTVAMAGAFEVANNLTFANSGILDTSDTNLTVGGTVSDDGTGTIQSIGSEILDIAGNITVDTIDFTGGSPTLQASADFMPVNFTAGSSTIGMDSAAVADLAGHAYFNLTFNKTAQTDVVTSNDALSVSNSLNMVSGEWDAQSFTHTITDNVNGGWDSTAANFLFTADTSTIILNNGAVSHQTGEGFYNLTANGAITLGTALEAGNDLLITSGNSLTATADRTITVGGNYTNNGTHTANGGLLTVTGNFSNTGTFHANTGTSQINGTTTNSGTFNAGTATITANNNVTNSGTFNSSGETLQLTGGGVFSGFSGAFAGTVDNLYDLIITSGAWSTSNDLVVRNLTQINGGSLDLSGDNFTSGTLELLGGDMTSGVTVNVVTGDFLLNSTNSDYSGPAVISVSGGDMNLTAGSSFSASGNILITDGDSDGDGHLNVSTSGTTGGAVSVENLSTFTGGVFTTNNTLTSTGLITVNGGTLTANALLTANAGLTLTTGAINGTGNINVNGNVNLDGGIFTAGSRNINVTGNWTETAGVLAADSSLVTFDGTTSLVTTVNPFYNLTVLADVTASSDIQVNNDLLVSTTGTLASSDYDITVTGNLDISSTTTPTLSITGTGALSVGGTTDIAAGSELSLGNGLVTLGNDTTDMVSNWGTITSVSDGAGNVTFAGDYVGNVSGVLTGSTAGNPRWTFNQDATFGTVTMNGDPVWFDSNVAHTLAINGASSFDTLVVRTDDRVNLNATGAGILTAAVLQTGDIAADNDTAIFDAASSNFDISTLANGGRFRLVGDQTTQAVGTYDIDSGWTEYYGGTVTLDNSDFADLWNLEISSGTYTLAQDMNVLGKGHDYDGNSADYDDEGFFLSGGTFNAGNNTIIVEEAFADTGGTFNCDTSHVIFTGSGDGYLGGTNTFYRLSCNYIAHTASPAVASDTSVSGKDLYFNPGETITLTTGGFLALSGDPATGPSNNPLTASYEPSTTYLSLRPTSEPADPDNPTAGEYWNLVLPAGTDLFMENVCAWYSNASSNPFVLQNNIYIWQCPGWMNYVRVLGTGTLDLDADGKIDALEVTLEVGIRNDFSDFTAQVTGYSVNGYQFGTAYSSDYLHFRILLDEQAYLDTGALPPWQILQNTSLVDDATGQKAVVITLASGSPASPYHGPNSPTDTPADTADPVLGYALAVPGLDQVFLHFSEPVYANGGGALGVGDLNFTVPSGVTPQALTAVTSNSGGVEEVLVSFSGALDFTDVLTGTVAMEDGSTNPVQDSVGNTADIATLTRNSAHALSDVLFGPTDNGPVEPLWAQDQTTASSTGSGTGVINEFDGTEHLKDDDITLQAHLNSDISLGTGNGQLDGSIELRFIQNPGTAYIDGNGLWLDTTYFSETDFSGLVPYELSGSVSTTGSAEASNDHVWNFTMSEGDISNSADLSFIFYLPGIGRYSARINDHTASDWYRRVSPWSFGVHNIVNQGAGVSILNNVINPLKGEQTTLYYNLEKGGMVSVQVFDLAGGLVEILHRGRQNAGEYSLSWNGTNRNNNPVARGIYFVRLVGPGVDEMRKVLVVK